MRAGRSSGQGSIALGTLLLAAAIGVAGAEAPEGGGPAAPSGGRIDDATLQRMLRLHYTERESVRMVLLATSVTDRKGRLVSGLEREDFQLYEDGRLQSIEFFSADASEPISIAFMLDLSGSMRHQNKLERAREAIRQVVGRLDPRDRVSLIGFADQQVSWITPFTGDHQRFLLRLEVQEAYGQTALNDAVAAAPKLVDAEVRGRMAILLFTDGVDNFSRMTMNDAVLLARRINVPIYAVGFLAIPEELRPEGSHGEPIRVLERVTRETGGRLFAVHGPAELDEALSSLSAELRQQYVIGYYPATDRVDGQFHSVDLRTHDRKLRVRTRSGYVAAR